MTIWTQDCAVTETEDAGNVAACAPDAHVWVAGDDGPPCLRAACRCGEVEWLTVAQGGKVRPQHSVGE